MENSWRLYLQINRNAAVAPSAVRHLPEHRRGSGGHWPAAVPTPGDTAIHGRAESPAGDAPRTDGTFPALNAGNFRIDQLYREVSPWRLQTTPNSRAYRPGPVHIRLGFDGPLNPLPGPMSGKRF